MIGILQQRANEEGKERVWNLESFKDHQRRYIKVQGEMRFKHLKERVDLNSLKDILSEKKISFEENKEKKRKFIVFGVHPLNDYSFSAMQGLMNHMEENLDIQIEIRENQTSEERVHNSLVWSMIMIIFGFHDIAQNPFQFVNKLTSVEYLIETCKPLLRGNTNLVSLMRHLEESDSDYGKAFRHIVREDIIRENLRHNFAIDGIKMKNILEIESKEVLENETYSFKEIMARELCSLLIDQFPWKSRFKELFSVDLKKMLVKNGGFDSNLELILQTKSCYFLINIVDSIIIMKLAKEYRRALNAYLSLNKNENLAELNIDKIFKLKSQLNGINGSRTNTDDHMSKLDLELEKYNLFAENIRRLVERSNTKNFLRKIDAMKRKFEQGLAEVYLDNFKIVFIGKLDTFNSDKFIDKDQKLPLYMTKLGYHRCCMLKEQETKRKGVDLSFLNGKGIYCWYFCSDTKNLAVRNPTNSIAYQNFWENDSEKFLERVKISLEGGNFVKNPADIYKNLAITSSSSNEIIRPVALRPQHGLLNKIRFDLIGAKPAGVEKEKNILNAARDIYEKYPETMKVFDENMEKVCFTNNFQNILIAEDVWRKLKDAETKDKLELGEILRSQISSQINGNNGSFTNTDDHATPWDWESQTALKNYDLTKSHGDDSEWEKREECIIDGCKNSRSAIGSKCTQCESREIKETLSKRIYYVGDEETIEYYDKSVEKKSDLNGNNGSATNTDDHDNFIQQRFHNYCYNFKADVKILKNVLIFICFSYCLFNVVSSQDCNALDSRKPNCTSLAYLTGQTRCYSFTQNGTTDFRMATHSRQKQTAVGDVSGTLVCNNKITQERSSLCESECEWGICDTGLYGGYCDIANFTVNHTCNTASDCACDIVIVTTVNERYDDANNKLGQNYLMCVIGYSRGNTNSTILSSDSYVNTISNKKRSETIITPDEVFITLEAYVVRIHVSATEIGNVLFRKDEWSILMTMPGQDLSFSLPDVAIAYTGDLKIDFYEIDRLVVSRSFTIYGSTACRMIDCIFCTAAFTNMKCLPTALIILIVVLILLCLIFLFWLIPSLCGPAACMGNCFCYSYKKIKIYYCKLKKCFTVDVDKLNKEVDDEFTELDEISSKISSDSEDSIEEKMASKETESSRLEKLQKELLNENKKRYRGSSSPRTMLSIFVFCLICNFGIVGAASCTGGQNLYGNTVVCTQGVGYENCSGIIQASITLPFPGSVYCATILKPDGAIMGKLEVIYDSVIMRINLDRKYYTSDSNVLYQTQHVCPGDGCNAGQCGNDVTRSQNGFITNPLILNGVGRSFCHTSCGCVTCGGCFFCSPSCVMTGWAIIPFGEIFRVDLPGQATAIPILIARLYSTDGSLIVEKAISISAGGVNVGGFIANVVGVFSAPPTDWGGNSVVSSLNARGSRLMGASVVNAPHVLQIGEIQAASNTNLIVSGSVFNYDVNMITVNQADLGDTVLISSVGVNTYDNPLSRIFPLIQGGNLWRIAQLSPLQPNQELYLESNLTSPGAISFYIETSSNFTFRRTINQVCPGGSFVNSTGCFSCSAGAKVYLRLRSVCSVGIASVSTATPGVTVMTTSVNLNLTYNDFIISVAMASASIQACFKVSGTGGDVDICGLVVTQESININDPINYTVGNKTDGPDGSHAKDALEWFNGLFNGTSTWWSQLLFWGAIVGMIVLGCLFLPSIIRFAKSFYESSSEKLKDTFDMTRARYDRVRNAF